MEMDESERREAEVAALKEAVDVMRSLANRGGVRPWQIVVVWIAPIVLLAGILWNQAASQTEMRLTIESQIDANAKTALLLSDLTKRQEEFEGWMREQYGDYRQWRHQVNGELRLNGGAGDAPKWGELPR